MGSVMRWEVRKGGKFDWAKTPPAAKLKVTAAPNQKADREVTACMSER
jgi:hypothetical protein